MAVTKNIKPVSDYQVWYDGDLTNGDILGVYESLGNRIADTVTIQASGANVVVRFNVAKTIYKDYGPEDQYAGMGQGLPGPNPNPVAEIVEEKTNVIVAAGTNQIWSSSELPIKDIQIISKGSGTVIIVT